MVFSGKGGIGGYGGKISTKWNASNFSQTGEHDFGAQGGSGLVGGANVGVQFRGTTNIGNIGDTLQWWINLFKDDPGQCSK